MSVEEIQAAIMQLTDSELSQLSAWFKTYLADLMEQQGKPAEPEYGYEYLKRILPNIELITVTDEDLANVTLNGPITECAGD